MLQSRPFINRLLRNQSFSRRVLSLIIDEAHCISHWGADFRKKYGTVGITRAFLPRGTPVIAVSATITARVRRDIQSKLHFPKSGSIYYNAGNNRPNVSIVVRACHQSLLSNADLDFIIPSSAKQPGDIPKTWVYIDDITKGNVVVDYLAARLCAQLQVCGAESRDIRGIVRPFNATLSHMYRLTAMDKFREGTVRILVCTDAAGMVCGSQLRMDIH